MKPTIHFFLISLIKYLLQFSIVSVEQGNIIPTKKI